MTDITSRGAKGSPLSYIEVDRNFKVLSDELAGKAEASTASMNVINAVNSLRDGVSSDGDTLKKLRALIAGLQTTISSDDFSLDTIQEFVARIKSDEGIIASLTTNKVNVVDIVNNMTTNSGIKPLSAAQGKILKDLIELEIANRISSGTAIQTIAADDATAKANNAQASAINACTPIAHAGSSGTSHALVTTGVPGFMSAPDKIKLDSISAGATVAPVTSVSGRTGNVILSKSDVGLANIDNTSDLNKPVSTAQAAANALVQTTAKNYTDNAINIEVNSRIANVAALNARIDTVITNSDAIALNSLSELVNAFQDADGDLSTSIAAMASNATSSLATEITNRQNADLSVAATAALDATTKANAAQTASAPLSHVGTNGIAHAIVTTTVAGFMSAADKAKLDGVSSGATVSPVISVANKTGAVLLNKTDVGLANVDNTSDFNKPISNAQATVNSLKVNISSIVDGLNSTDGTVPLSAAQGKALNDLLVAETANRSIDDINTLTSARLYTDIESTRASTAENLLVAKTVTVNGHALSSNVVVTAGDVGLGNANNTSDVNKPVSIAQAAADTDILNLAKIDATTKADIAQTNAINASTPLAHVGTGGVSHADVAASGASGFMTGTDKAKLDSIATGAQVNVATNISEGTRTSTTVPVISSTGNDAVLSPVTQLLAGVMSAADKTKLDGIAVGATATLGTITAVTATAPIISTGGTTPVISITDVTTVASGSMSAADKVKLNNITGTNTGDQTTITGNAGSATKLATARNINGVAFDGTGNITINAIDSTDRIASSLIGEMDGVCPLDVNRLIPTQFLPSFVDDVIEVSTLSAFPVTGLEGKIYVALDTNKTYRWSGSVYIYITSGAVDSVAGKTGVVTLVKADVGLANVDNTSDVNKPVSTAQASAIGLKSNTASPAFTGVPTAPTAAVSTNTTQIATTAFVSAEILSDTAPITHVGSSGAAHAAVTTVVNGFMTAVDKVKLDSISSGANAYNLPVSTATILGGVKVGTGLAVDAGGLLTATTNGVTNLGQGTNTATNVTVTSSTGASASLASATTALAGVLSAADKTKLDGIAAGAQVNTVTSVAARTGAVVLAKADVGLANVDNTSDASKPVSTAQAAADALKANIASPTFTGVPLAPTAAIGTNTTQLATTAFVNAEISNDTPTKAGVGATGTWSISITGNSATSTALSGFTNSNSVNPIVGPDSVVNNGIGYVNGVSVLGQIDGALYSQAYSAAYISQIFQDYRTGQIALRGKNNGVWTGWRTVWDSVNLTNLNQLSNGPGYATGGGTASGTNSGDETNATIKTKLGITTLSGSNTGDQVIPTSLPASDVYAWAKSSTKPVYGGNEISASRDNAATDLITAKELRWKNFGAAHTVIDASASTAPNGAAISNTNPANVWTPTYPTLMGWNGNSTYGVRVDSARVSDSTSILTGPASVNGADGWFRSTGGAGWYNATHSVGIYATEAGNVRTYNGANFISGGTVSGTNLSGTNTGDETTATIKTKLGVTTLTGANTGDQVIPTSLPASDVYAWAKAAAKPTYTAAEVSAIPTSFFASGGLAEIGRYLDMHGGTGAATDYDVRIDCGPGTGVAGGGTLTITAAGGLVSSGNVTAFSDERLKKDWTKLSSDFVYKLAEVKSGAYTRIDTEQRQVGVSAQSLQVLLPEAVLDGEYLSVAYGNAALVSTIELAKEHIALKELFIKKQEENNSNIEMLVSIIKKMEIRLQALEIM